MQTYRIEVFEKTRRVAILRLKDEHGDLLKERNLDLERVDAFTSEVEKSYRQTSPDLPDLGRRLYDFIDGGERWLDDLVGDPAGTVLRIDVDHRLRHLPWELMAADGSYLVANTVRPFTPVRAVSEYTGRAEVANRPLRILLMATSPEGVMPVLDFEGEEAMILDATAGFQVDLFVEESGSLEGLQFMVQSYGRGFFDVLHLSGHADVIEDQPVFLTENEVGARVDATATDIAEALQGMWPGLVFLSGCKTGEAPQEGMIPSMSEALVEAGAPGVLGWSLPVGDQSASLLASFLYRSLAGGMSLKEAVARARNHLLTERSVYWHLLRIYADSSRLSALVTPLHHPDRTPFKVRRASSKFLDDEGKIKVASRESFVGRRRMIQRSLDALRKPMGSPGSHEGLLLHGMGGLGKSTLASRIVERMQTHQSAVWAGRLDETELLKLPSRLDFATIDLSEEANKILNRPGISLADRMRYLLSGPMQALPCLFVFDDFEEGNLERRENGHVMTPDSVDSVRSALDAIRATGSQSRVIITSRYQFDLPPGSRVHMEALESMHGPELEKKLRQMTGIGPDSDVDEGTRDRAIEASAGIPRLLEWLDQLVIDEPTDVDSLLRAIESKAEEFREDVLADELLAAQDPELKRMLALVDVFELPVPLSAVQAVAGDINIATHLERASAVGLIEAGTDPETHARRYLVSNVLTPLLVDTITNEERVEACATGARALNEVWVAV